MPGPQVRVNGKVLALVVKGSCLWVLPLCMCAQVEAGLVPALARCDGPDRVGIHTNWGGGPGHG